MTPQNTTEHDRRRERRLDETVQESFPASDPPAHSGITGVRPAATQTEESAHPELVKSATEARQGRETGHVRWILRISMVLVILGLVLVAWWTAG